uniref:Uncharacterized protein n=1 Tax=Rhizophora mucronata TaxID=61149 RepID=A0A2P2P5D2_RHIMU
MAGGSNEHFWWMKARVIALLPTRRNENGKKFRS